MPGILGGRAAYATVVRLGIRLPAAFESAGEFLADGQAAESAGADLLLLGEGGHDRWLLAAALLSATQRVGMAAPGDGPQLSTLKALARGRLVTSVMIHGNPDLELLRLTSTGEDWVELPFPAGKAEWRETLRAYSEVGVGGIILPHDPRLIDLIRNADVEEDRTDLQLAQG